MPSLRLSRLFHPSYRKENILWDPMWPFIRASLMIPNTSSFILWRFVFRAFLLCHFHLKFVENRNHVYCSFHVPTQHLTVFQRRSSFLNELHVVCMEYLHVLPAKTIKTLTWQSCIGNETYLQNPAFLALGLSNSPCLFFFFSPIGSGSVFCFIRGGVDWKELRKLQKHSGHANMQRKMKECQFISHLPLYQCQEIPGAVSYNVNNSHDCVGDFQLWRAVGIFGN